MGEVWPEAADVSPVKDTRNKFEHDSLRSLPVAAIGIEHVKDFGDIDSQLRGQTIAGGEGSSPWCAGGSAGVEKAVAGNRRCNPKQ
mmetsp:Transcript_108134/g.187169  ORF Transcript_108134/g.187169 Transcript_108134/m.187169 type:complete len:86 (-) Transcript_108134:198-455(-)